MIKVRVNYWWVKISGVPWAKSETGSHIQKAGKDQERGRPLHVGRWKT